MGNFPTLKSGVGKGGEVGGNHQHSAPHPTSYGVWGAVGVMLHRQFRGAQGGET